MPRRAPPSPSEPQPTRGHRQHVEQRPRRSSCQRAEAMRPGRHRETRRPQRTPPPSQRPSQIRKRRRAPQAPGGRKRSPQSNRTGSEGEKPACLHQARNQRRSQRNAQRPRQEQPPRAPTRSRARPLWVEPPVGRPDAAPQVSERCANPAWPPTTSAPKKANPTKWRW